jgi:signal transduction histidine kinase
VVDLGQLVHEVLDDLGPPAGLEIETEASWPTLEIRRLRLKQVLSNLITNAIKYHDKKGRGGYVAISWRLRGEDGRSDGGGTSGGGTSGGGTSGGGTSGGGTAGGGAAGAKWAGALELAVADNGPGIAREHHQKIFQIFQTLQPRDKVESTGLGLALVAKLVEDEGGKVWVESEVGRGSVFKVLWPAGKAAGETADTTKNHHPTGAPKAGRTE